ncbi:MAG: zincin-like metallopeptidase domain-containing protein [Gammaproteobacteria bacterium]
MAINGTTEEGLRMKAMTLKKTTYQVVTDRIVDLLNQGVAPWRMPWKGGRAGWPKNLLSGKEYNGVNVLLLACQGYSSSHWVTFNQSRELGGCVRKGERGTPVVFWKTYEEESSDELDKRFVIRHSTVFNLEQCDGLECPETPPSQPAVPFCADKGAERVVESYCAGPTVRHGGGRACYRPSTDEVHLPDRRVFDAPAHYYATLFHELGHSTGHSTRLARPGISDEAMMRAHAYAKEELVAECIGAFLCGEAGISPMVIDNQAAYLASWIAVLQGDPTLVVRAAGAAAKGADLILGRNRQADPDSPSEVRHREQALGRREFVSTTVSNAQA